MKKKQFYEAPETELINVLLENHFLEGSVMASRLDYTMDAGEDWEY